MLLATIAFYLFSTVLIAAALLVVSARNPVHSVLFLIMAFFNAAALFVLLGAEFLAMVLIVVYVGAVAVLFLFVVMARFIGANHPKATLPLTRNDLGMGHPDEPGDDEQGGEGGFSYFAFLTAIPITSNLASPNR